MTDVFHLALASDWAAAQSSGEYLWSTRGMRIDQVGFMHASFADQIEGVIDRFYSDVSDSLLVLTLDVEALEKRGMKLLVEPVVPSDPTSERFPHLYGGALPVEGVTAVRRYRRLGPPRR